MSNAVSPLVWVITVVGLLAIVALDLVVIARRRGTVTVRQATRWVSFYVGLAAVFAGALFALAPSWAGGQFVAGYITEYSLSVDNLFVFVIIMAKFGVPSLAEDMVLYIGIVASLMLRAVFIAAGGSSSTPRPSSPSRATPTSPTSTRAGSSAACAESCPPPLTTRGPA
jgi:tellurite resistance protein TerC